jgi:hypothetical protein
MSFQRAGTVAFAAVFVALVALSGPAAAGESQRDKAILKAGVITKDDVPSGWTSKKSSASSTTSYRGISECKAIKTAIDNAKKNLPRADSRDFEDPSSDGTTAENAVYVFKDSSAASKFVANFQGDVAMTCLEKSIERSPVGRSADEPPTISPIADLQGVGDEAVGYQMTLTLTIDGEQGTAYIDFVVVRAGRAFVGFGFTNVGEPLPDGPDIVQAVVARVAEAQTST